MRRTRGTVAILFGLFAAIASAGCSRDAATDATNFRTRLHAVEPQRSGVDVKIVHNGYRIQITNRSDDDIIVYGYQGEPYLRIGRDGVAENVRSPATYINRDRQGTTPVPGYADPEADPEWSPVDDGNVARWHDHRIHWMGSSNPAEVQAEPDRRHIVIPDWVVPLMAGTTELEVRGDLIWEPGPSPLPWWGVALALLGATLAATLWAGRRRAAVVGAVALLVVLDVAHAWGIAAAVADGPGRLSDELVQASALSTGGWIVGVAAIGLVLHGRQTGLTAAALAGGCLAIGAGISYLDSLESSGLLFVWPDATARVATASSLGIGLGLVLSELVRLLRHDRRPI